MTNKVLHNLSSSIGSRNGDGLMVAMVTLLAVSVIMNVISLYLLLGFSLPLKFLADQDNQNGAMGIQRALLGMEYAKVGGKENFELLQKYSLMKLNQSLPQLKAELDANKGNTGDQTAQQQAPAQPSITGADTPRSMTQDEVSKIVSNAALEGNKAASILVIEYSDMECPFCLRQFHETKLFPKLLEQYGDKVALAFKNNRGVNHPGTEAKALGALCALKVGGDKQYQKFYKGVMEKSASNAVMPTSDLPALAKSIGLDIKKWQTCVDNKDMMTRFADETKEANQYNLSGTPGTLIVNVKTGKYVTIEGAYPYEKFTANIDSLLK